MLTVLLLGIYFQQDLFYLFCTGNGITVYSSNDLNNWKPENQVFDKAPEWTKNVVIDFNENNLVMKFKMNYL